MTPHKIPPAVAPMVSADRVAVMPNVSVKSSVCAHNDRMVEWANTSRGRRQFDMVDLIARADSQHSCSSAYGLCE